jgi:putative ABC transport system permease protein
VYVPIRTAQRMLAMGDRISEVVLLTTNVSLLPQMSEALAKTLGEEYEVTTYRELLPALMAILDVREQAMGVYYLIIGIATIFGIINTLLMSVFERIREFGVLMATGMKDGMVFSMILLEALVLGIVGTIVGLIAGLMVYIPLWKYGLDLSAFAEGLSWIGVSTIVYPLLSPDALLRIVLIIPFISVMAALYPATKAVRLVPVRAIYYL